MTVRRYRKPRQPPPQTLDAAPPQTLEEAPPSQAAAANDPSTPVREEDARPPLPPPSSISSPPPSRRRSLRLAGLASPSPDAAAGSGGNRKRVKRGETEARGDAEAEARVSDCPYGEMGGTDAAADQGIDGGRMSLLSDSTIGVIDGEMRLSTEEKGKGKLDDEERDMFFEIDRGDKSRRFSPEEKGKGKLVIEEGWLTIGRPQQPPIKLDDVAIVVEEVEGSVNQIKAEAVAERRMESRRESDRRRAISLAPKFALFKPEDEGIGEEEEDSDKPSSGADQDDEDWPGPFSTAMKIIAERDAVLRARELKSDSNKDRATKVIIPWTPAKDRKGRPAARRAPALKDLCLNVLSENAEEIESLDGVPDVLKHALLLLLCHSKKMTTHALGLVATGCPTKILLSDCTWATEEQIEGVLVGCNTENLKVLQLDMCGRCMTDYVLRRTLAQSPNSLPFLTTLSLKGAYRLSDDGLNAIAFSSPLLTTINLGQCSLLTSDGIISLANKLDTVLRALHIDDCQNVDAIKILPALKKLKHLEVLSVARIETVSDKFVKALVSFAGPKLRELVLAGCCKLTAASMKTIGEKCSGLSSLDLQNLNRLNDSAIGYIANGCRSILKLKLRRNGFSDEAIAAFLEASGEALTELSLNNVMKVAYHTAMAISRRCSLNLKNLNLSFCRLVTDEAMGLIVDSCPNLSVLKLFGCTQITGVFLDGHSNSNVNIIGLKQPILEQIERSDYL